MNFNYSPSLRTSPCTMTESILGYLEIPVVRLSHTAKTFTERISRRVPAARLSGGYLEALKSKESEHAFFTYFYRQKSQKSANIKRRLRR